MTRNGLTREVIGAAMRVHSELGPGLLESTYRSCLCHELRISGIAHESEIALPITYRDLKIEAGYRIDILVEGELIVETKAVSKIVSVHEAQLLSYLRLSRRSVGLLINFHVRHLRHGIKRMVNNYRNPENG